MEQVEQVLYFEEQMVIRSLYIEHLQRSNDGAGTSELFEHLPTASSLIAFITEMTTRKEKTGLYSLGSGLKLISNVLLLDLASDEEREELKQCLFELYFTLMQARDSSSKEQDDCITNCLDVLHTLCITSESLLLHIKTQISLKLNREVDRDLLKSNEKELEIFVCLYEYLVQAATGTSEDSTASLIDSLLSIDIVSGKQDTLYYLLKYSFNSQQLRLKVHCLRLCADLCVKTKLYKYLKIIDYAMFTESTDIKFLAVTLFWEICYCKPQLNTSILTGNDTVNAEDPLISYLSQFVDSESEEIQLISLISLARIVCSYELESSEEWLTVLVRKYCQLQIEIRPTQSKKKSKEIDARLKFLRSFFSFLQSSTPAKQELIANTIIHIIANSINDETLSVEQEHLDDHTSREIQHLSSMLLEKYQSTLVESIMVNIRSLFNLDISEQRVRTWIFKNK